VFVFITHEAAGASTPGIPHALDSFRGDRLMHTSGAPRRGNAEACLVIARSIATLTVIASEAKQSTARATVIMDWFVASLLAMTTLAV